jgi:YVTN family beta-propeller protein
VRGAILACLCILTGPGAPVGASGDAAPAAPHADHHPASLPQSAPPSGRLTREGVQIEFSARPLGGNGPLVEGGHAEVSFRITDEQTGKPIRSLAPGAWMDLGDTLAGKEGQSLDCRQRMGLYLSGRVGIRPMIDLNSYFILALNRDSSISVIDPHVGMAGRTYLYAHIPLPRPGADWAQSGDAARLFVTIPRSGQVAVVDTEHFKLAQTLDVGGMPVRIVPQADGRYLWIGDDSPEAGQSGVVVLDAATLAVAARIPTGSGHHEIALSPDDRYAFVTNRTGGTVSVIEVATLKKVKDVRIGKQPLALAYSRQSQALYVADGTTGEVVVVDGRDHRVAARIQAKPGLGPLRFTEDGRWAFAVNSAEHAVHVLDASTNRLAHTIPVGGRPFHLSVSAAFAYVRSLDSAQVTMIPLGELDQSRTPSTTNFAAGDTAPGTVGPGLAIGAPIVPALGEAAVVVANPADGGIYYYMEGMVAPMATFRNYGHRPAALTVVNRSLREGEPGVYTTKVRLPMAGRYDVGFLLDSPQVVHCFAAEVGKSPTPTRTGPPLALEYLVKDRRAAVGELTVAFKLTDAETGTPKSGLNDVRVLSYLAPGRHRAETTAREVGAGVYEARLRLTEAGVHYVHVAVPSARVGYQDLRQLSLIAGAMPARAGTPGPK